MINFIIGKTPERSNDLYWNNGIYHWVSISDMNSNKKIYNTRELISVDAANICFRNISPKGSLLMSFKLTVGRTSILMIDAYHNEAIITVNPFIDLNNIFRNYMFYFLPLISNNGESKDAIKGKTLNSNSIYNLLLPLPPLAEQKRIVDKIEELMPLIEQYGKAQSELDALNSNIREQLKKSILQYAIEGKLVPQSKEDGTAEELLAEIQTEKQRLYDEGKLKKKDLSHSTIFKAEDNKYFEKKGKDIICIDDEIPFEIPKGWKWCRLGDVGFTITGSTPPKNNSDYFGSYIFFIGPGNIQNLRIINKTQGLSKLGLKYGTVAPINSILQVCIGGSIGKTAITDGSIAFNQQINSITPILCIVEFIHYILQSNYFQLSIINKSTGTATPIINRANWENIIIPIPPLAEQERIVAKIEELMPLVQ